MLFDHLIDNRKKKKLMQISKFKTRGKFSLTALFALSATCFMSCILLFAVIYFDESHMTLSKKENPPSFVSYMDRVLS